MEVLSNNAALAAVGAAAAGGLYMYLSSGSKFVSDVPLDCQSIELAGMDKVRVAAPREDEPDRPRPPEFVSNDAKTTHDCFLRGVRVSGDKPFLGARTGPENAYEWLTYNEVLERVTHLGSGLRHEGCQPKDLVGIFSSNRIEWVIAEQAMTSHSIVSVPLYDTLGAEALDFILQQTKMAVCFCEPKKVASLLDQVVDRSSLRLIIKMGEVTEEEEERAKSLGVQILSMQEIEDAGKRHPHAKDPPTPDDLVTICYTSGTTGNPKGAMLTHRNLVSSFALVHGAMKAHYEFKDMVHICYLPLAHSFERLNHISVTQFGGRIGFFRGDPNLLLDDIKTLQPTIFLSVPRLFNRIYDRVMDGVSQAPAHKRMLFNFALRMKRRQVESGIITNSSIWDRLIFNKIQALLGGKVEAIASGAAPISSEVLMFLRCVFGCHVIQGYGQTESAATATITLPGDSSCGHVGPPVPGMQIKLVSVPELNYHLANKEGEICLKGPNIFVGYFNDKEKTEEALDNEGWLHSGDIGRWQANGTLAIIDRKKHIFKLAQGEYIAPEKVEGIYIQAPLVGQVFVHGISLHSWCVAIICPDENVLPRWAKKNNITGTLEELCKNEEVRRSMLQQITNIGREKGLKSFEQAKAIHLHPEPFSIDNGLLTPTLKLKRHPLCQFFEKEIAEMYEKLQADNRKKSSS